ncbi:MAG: DUF2723 domain-containing protein [Deltaproteobacteria bacterium]|nr:MAG: DUF2723 domain-containing protein [Deltaproteobacteria bacterium]
MSTVSRGTRPRRTMAGAAAARRGVASRAGEETPSVVTVANAVIRRYNAALGFGVAVAATYLVACARTVQPGDSGEFATILLRGGIPHPPGYPLMRMLGGIARTIEAAGVPSMWAAALPCALFGAAGFAVLARIVAPPRVGWTGLALVALAGVSPTALGHVPDAEVWGLSVFLASLVVASVLADPAPPPWRTGLLLGLAGAHHQTSVFLVPMVACAEIHRASGTTCSARARSAIRRISAVAAGALLGLSAYATLAVGEGGAFRWGDPSSPAGLVHHVLRRDFGTFDLGLSGLDLPAGLLVSGALSRIANVFTLGLVDAPTVGALVLLLAGVPVLRPARPFAGRLVAFGSYVSLLLSSVVFAALGNLDPRSPFARWILERFDLLPLVLVVPLLAAALHPVLARVGRLRSISPRLAGAVLVSGLFVTQAARGFAHGVPADERTTEAYARAALASAAAGALRAPPKGLPGAILLGLDDHRTFPVLYRQAVGGDAPQVLYLDASLLAHPWYRARARARFPAVPDVDRPVRLIGSLWTTPEGRTIPVFVTHRFSRPLVRDVGLVPHGTIYRVTGPASAPPPPLDASAAAHLRALEAVRTALGRPAGAPLLDAAPVPAGHPFAGDLLLAAADPTRELVEALRRAGRDALADRVVKAFSGRSP